MHILFYSRFFYFFVFFSTILTSKGFASETPSYKIGVVGTGYVGLVLGTCLAEIGHTVTCCDLDTRKIDSLNNGLIPIYEHGLEELVSKNLHENRLFFTTEVAQAIQSNDIIFITVGTPESLNGEANLDFVFDTARTIGKNLKNPKTIFVKSTVPMGTVQKIKEIITNHNTFNTPFEIGYAPEFLREGSSVNDFMNPDRVVIGAENSDTASLFKKIVAPILKKGAKFLSTSIASAEMIKYASNSFLSVKISFINEIADFCELVGADVDEVALGIGLDKRIGAKFLKPGPGFGGSCFPKDTLAFLKAAEKNGTSLHVIQAAVDVNDFRPLKIVDRLETMLKSFEGKKIALLGLAFKEETDDVRASPALKLMEIMVKKGAFVQAYDPIAGSNVRNDSPNFEVKASLMEALEGVDAVLLATPWKEFLEFDWKKGRLLTKGNLFFDCRNLLDPVTMGEASFECIQIGKK
jgi:UDPglucose 6-dehydrogenase